MKTKSKKSSSSDNDSESEHELAYYTGDRIKLMQQAFKLIKPKSLLAMTPDCVKDLQVPAIKSLLLEELLGISNKRLRLILAGENLDVNSSSSESEIENKPDDIISLDDITESSEICISDDNCMEIQLSERERLEMEIERPKTDKKFKTIHRSNHKVIVKKENDRKLRRKRRKKTIIKEEKESESNVDNPVMNVLNLLELQARARAIRSQLANEILADKVGGPSVENNAQSTQLPDPVSDGENSANSVIFVSPKSSPVVLVHSESDLEENKDSNLSEDLNEKNHVSNDAVIEKNNGNDNTEPKNETLQTERTVDDDYSDDILIVSEDSILDKESEVLSQKTTEGDTNEDNVSTWKSRWLESPRVKDVLRTNKIYNNLRQSRKQKVASPLHVTESTSKPESENSNAKGIEVSNCEHEDKASDVDNVSITDVPTVTTNE